MSDVTVLPGVTVTAYGGARPYSASGGSGGGGGGSGPDAPQPDTIGGDPGGQDPAYIPDPNQSAKECAAGGFASTLKETQPFARDKKEFFSWIWNRNGSVANHVPTSGSGAGITRGDFNEARAAHGIGFGDVMGLAHNHPEDVYCDSSDTRLRSDQRTFNAYPSSADWNYATELV